MPAALHSQAGPPGVGNKPLTRATPPAQLRQKPAQPAAATHRQAPEEKAPYGGPPYAGQPGTCPTSKVGT
ncbi:hypothetical protein GCM10010272_70700 [Streptomyces lateritius]|nr:hypothetical protein GCM10010272_70700 [Streptomyces lateritius]